MSTQAFTLLGRVPALYVTCLGSLHNDTGGDVPERDYPQFATIEGFIAYVCSASHRPGVER